MPSRYRGEGPYPGQEYLLRHAAEANQIIVYRCNLCRKLVRYLASDLVTILHPDPRCARATARRNISMSN